MDRRATCSGGRTPGCQQAPARTGRLRRSWPRGYPSCQSLDSGTAHQAESRPLLRTLTADSVPWVECAGRRAWAGHSAGRQLAARQLAAGPPQFSHYQPVPGRGRLVRLKPRLRLAQPGPFTWRQQAVVAHLHPSASLRAGSSLREHMLEKALAECCRRQRLGAPTTGVAHVVAKGNLALLRLENPVVAQRHAEDVGRQILEHGHEVDSSTRMASRLSRSFCG